MSKVQKDEDKLPDFSNNDGSKHRNNQKLEPSQQFGRSVVGDTSSKKEVKFTNKLIHKEGKSSCFYLIFYCKKFDLTCAPHPAAPLSGCRRHMSEQLLADVVQRSHLSLSSL